MKSPIALPSSFTLLRIPETGEIVDVLERSGDLVPAYCRSALTNAEYRPENGEIISGSLMTLHEDLKQLKMSKTSPTA